MTAAGQAQDGYWEPEHGSYTKLNHYYFRQLIPILRLNSVQQSIISAIIDGSVGWHKKTARISYQQFAEKAQCSISTIIRDMSKLRDLGLAVVVEQGTGRTTTEYTLDFHCEIGLLETAKRLGISKEQLIEGIQEGRIKLNDRPPLRIVEPPEPKIIPAANPAENPSPSPEPEEIDNPASEEKKSPENPAIPAFRVVTVTPPPKRKEASSQRDTVIIKTNIDVVIVDTSLDRKEIEQKRKAAIAAVCSLFRKFFQIEIQRKHWKFAGKCIKVFGAEAVIEKIKIAECQLKRGVKVANPLGWLWSALSNAYGFSKYDTDKMAGDERARLEIEASDEKSRTEREERDRDTELLERASEIEEAMTRGDREAMQSSVDEAIEAGSFGEFAGEELHQYFKIEFMTAKGLL